MTQTHPPQHDGQPLQPPYQQQMPAYSPGQPMYPPQPPAAKKPRRWPWIIALIVVFFIGMGVGTGVSSGSHSNTTTTTTTNTTPSGSGTSAQPTAAKPTTAPEKPTAVPKWTMTHTFTGSGSKKTAVFTVGNDWKIAWTCNPASFSGSQYNLIVGVNNSDNTPVDPAAINTLCKTGNTSDNTEEHQAGTVYLDITSEADWTIHVQELK